MTYRVPTVIAGTSGTTLGKSFAIGKPASMRVGDLLVLCVFANADAKHIAVPSGFTPIVDEINQDDIVHFRCWYKWATNAEPTEYTVIVDGADDVIYNLFIVRGASAFSVIDVTDSTKGSSSPPIAEPGVTTTADNCLAIAALMLNDSPGAIVQPSGWTLLESSDGPVGTISVGIAKKPIASAGSSGGASWSAGTGIVDYIAATFAISPGVMSLDDTMIYAPQQLLAKTLADCTEFRNLVGASGHSEALARIWHEALPPPASHADQYSLTELQGYRPYAIIFTQGPSGILASRQAASPGAWSDQGALGILIEFDTPSEMQSQPDVIDHLMKQVIGRIIQRPSDESSSFDGLLNLFHTTNEVDSYSYLAGDSIELIEYHRSAPKMQPAQGDFVYALLKASYGARA